MSSELPKLRTLDVRPMIARGEEPFSKIMALVQSTAPGDGFAIISPFMPAPLIEKLQAEGFTVRPEHRADGSWKTQFVRPKPA